MRKSGEENVVPASLATVTSPPIIRASLRLMARPKPVPPNRRAVRIRLAKFREQLRLLLGGHADPRIADRKLDPVGAVNDLSRRELDLALLGELAGVLSWRRALAGIDLATVMKCYFFVGLK
jgi:hypothetical protein